MGHRVTVVGSGVVGLCVALKLQDEGFEVEVLDAKDPHPPASWGNAGHLAVEQVEPLASLASLASLPSRLFWRGGALSLPARSIPSWLPFSLRFIRAARPDRYRAGTAMLREMLQQSIPAWRRLATLAGVPESICERGHFIGWESKASTRRGLARWQAADTGTAHVAPADRVDKAKLDALLIRPLEGAARITGSGHVSDPGGLLEALADSLLARGGCITPITVTALTRHRHEGIALTGVTREGLPFESVADKVVLCAGARSGDLLRPLGHSVPLIDERGYHVEADVSEIDWPAKMPPVVFEDRQMIVTRFAGKLRAAAFVELSRPGAPPDPAKWARLEQHGRELGLPLGETPRRWHGSRPTLPDYLPAIGASEHLAGLFYAFGHQHLGLTLAASTAETVAKMLGGETAPPALSLKRF